MKGFTSINAQGSEHNLDKAACLAEIKAVRKAIAEYHAEEERRNHPRGRRPTTQEMRAARPF